MSLEEEIKKLTSSINELIKRMDRDSINKIEALSENNETRFIPVTQWSKYHSWPPIGGLRNLIFNARHNGISVAIKKVGKRVLINEKEFFKWIENNPNIK